MWQRQLKAWGINIQSVSVLFLFLDAIASPGYERILDSQARMKGEKRTYGRFEDEVSSSRVFGFGGVPAVF